jgi:perosamine synthetase
MIHLKQKGIASGVHFLPLPLHPLFRSHREAIPVAERVWKTMLTLPLFPDLTEEEVDYIIDALIEFDRNSFS